MSPLCSPLSLTNCSRASLSLSALSWPKDTDKEEVSKEEDKEEEVSKGGYEEDKEEDEEEVSKDKEEEEEVSKRSARGEELGGMRKSKTRKGETELEK